MPGFPPAHGAKALSVKQIIPARHLERDVVVDDVRRAARARGGGGAVRRLLHRRRAAERIIGRLEGTAGVAAAAAVEEGQFAAKAGQHDLRRLALIAVAIGVFASLQLSFEKDFRALLAILLGDLAQILVEDHDIVPFGPLLALAGGFVAPGLGGGEREAYDRIAGAGSPDLGIAAEITDENDLVDAPSHGCLPYCKRQIY